MNDKLKFLFGFPYHKVKINPSLYNKQKLLEDFEANYKIDPLRDKWKSNRPHAQKENSLHHSIDDVGNPKFLSLDDHYQKLKFLYDLEIKFFFNSLNIKGKISWASNITDYALSRGQVYLSPHHHIQAGAFTAIHYVSFDAENHSPTAYVNGHSFSQYIDMNPSYTILKSKLDPEDPANSWLFNDYCLSIDEDDFVIIPTSLTHLVPLKKNQGDKLRATIVLDTMILD
jgi:hypothetical protein